MQAASGGVPFPLAGPVPEAGTHLFFSGINPEVERKCSVILKPSPTFPSEGIWSLQSPHLGGHEHGRS